MEPVEKQNGLRLKGTLKFAVIMGGVLAFFGVFAPLFLWLGLLLDRPLCSPWDALGIWPYVALGWTLCFALYYYHELSRRGREVRADPRAIFLITLMMVLCGGSMWALWAGEWPLHVITLFLVACFLLITDWILHNDYSKGENTAAAERAKLNVIVADLPVVISFSAIILSASMYSLFTPKPNRIENFLEGAFAFQLLVSNTIFFFIESQLIDQRASGGLAALLCGLWQDLIGKSARATPK